MQELLLLLGNSFCRQGIIVPLAIWDGVPFGGVERKGNQGIPCRERFDTHNWFEAPVASIKSSRASTCEQGRNRRNSAEFRRNAQPSRRETVREAAAVPPGAGEDGLDRVRGLCRRGPRGRRGLPHHGVPPRRAGSPGPGAGARQVEGGARPPTLQGGPPSFPSFSIPASALK